MAKRAREQAVKEKRELKRAKKAERALAKLEGTDESDDEAVAEDGEVSEELSESVPQPSASA